MRRLATALSLLLAAVPLAAQEVPVLRDGDAVLLRHASAPGTGDPPDFRIGDCGTQRNLDASGRAQARRIGAALRGRGAPVTAVYTSQWCRARETAALAFPGVRAQEQPAFNSFFGARRGQQPQQTRAALALLREWKGPGVLAVTTHQVNITALTGSGLASGEGVVVRWREGKLQTLGRIPPP